jgi:hypothetical protein
VRITRRNLSKFVKNYLSEGASSAPTCSRRECFDGLSREGVILGKLVEYSVLDALLGHLRGGPGPTPEPGTFSGTQDVDKFFTNPKNADFWEDAFGVYKAAYYAVQSNQLFDSLGTPEISDIDQSTDAVDVPTTTADIHVKYNEQSKGGRFGNIRQLTEDEAGTVEGFYSRELWDEAMNLIYPVMRLNPEVDMGVAVRNEKGVIDWKENMLAGRFLKEENGINRGGILESSGQRRHLKKYLGIVEEKTNPLWAALQESTSQANNYRKNPNKSTTIKWSEQASEWNKLKKMLGDNPGIDAAEQFMAGVDQAFVEFSRVKKAWQLELKNQYANLIKLLEGEDISGPGGSKIKAPILAGKGYSFTEAFKLDLMRVLFNHLIEDREADDSLNQNSVNIAESKEKMVAVLRVCWKCGDNVEVIIEEFHMPGTPLEFVESLDVKWDTSKAGLGATIGPGAKEYFYLRQRSDGKSTGPQYGGGKDWVDLIKSTYSVGVSNAEIRWSGDRPLEGHEDPGYGFMQDDPAFSDDDSNQSPTLIPWVRQDDQGPEVKDEELGSVSETSVKIYDFLFNS